MIMYITGDSVLVVMSMAKVSMVNGHLQTRILLHELYEQFIKFSTKMTDILHYTTPNAKY